MNGAQHSIEREQRLNAANVCARTTLALALALAALGPASALAQVPDEAAPAAAVDPAAVAPRAIAPEPISAGAAAAPAANAPSPVRVEAHVEPVQPKFGERVELVVTLRYPSDVRAFFPGKPELRPLLAIAGDPGKTERRQEGDETIEVLRIPALAARTGLLRTPRIEVPWHRVVAGGAAGESGTVEVPPMSIEVQSALGDETAPKAAPLPAPLPLVEDNTPLRIGIFVLLMMVLGGVLTAIGLRILRDRLRQVDPEPVIPPHVLAFQRLEALVASGRVEAEEPRLIYGELSEILRAYLAGRYRISALDMTSTELLDALHGRELGGLQLTEVQDFTAEGDLVKFARLPLAPEELMGRLSWIRRVVERTMQTAAELERLREQQIARLARQRRLRIEVMAPAQLRLAAFGIDAALGGLMTALLAWLAIDTQKQGLFDAAYAVAWLWMAVRDLLGEGSPGKSLVGLRIAQWDPRAEIDPDAALHDERAAREVSRRAQSATAGQRILRNAALLLPGAGLIAEADTLFRLPELRRLGDHWAGTRVIDARYGLRRGKPTWRDAIVWGLVAVLLLALPLLLGGRPQ